MADLTYLDEPRCNDVPFTNIVRGHNDLLPTVRILCQLSLLLEPLFADDFARFHAANLFGYRERNEMVQ